MILQHTCISYTQITSLQLCDRHSRSATNCTDWLLSTTNQTAFLLNKLNKQGLDIRDLLVIFCAIIVSHIDALTAFYDLLNRSDIRKINVFLEGLALETYYSPVHCKRNC